MVDSVGLLTVQQKDVETILGFSGGKLILREVSLRNALDDLGRWYNAEVRIGTPELADISLNTTLVTGNVEDLIEVLRLAFHARVVRQGRVVTMYAQ
jgi:ferric-dicitrate binding protein FerR (iron transport regulator)